MRLSLFLLLSIAVAILPEFRVSYYHANIPQDIAKSFLQLNSEIKEDGQFELLNIDRTPAKSEKYLCFRPLNITLQKLDSDLAQEQVSSPTLDDLKLKAVQTVADSFKREVCTFHSGSYWIYGYCFGDKIIQFHPDMEHFRLTGKHKPTEPDYVYTLGRFKGGPRNEIVKIENEAQKHNNQLDPGDFSIHDDLSTPFSNSLEPKKKSPLVILHVISDGEICDLTGQPRSVEVVYKCHASNSGFAAIMETSEVKTCQYQMTINLPELCNIEGFKPIRNDENVLEIECKRVDTNSVAGKESNPVGSDKTVQLLDFYEYTDDLPFNDKLFPVTANYKINVRDYKLIPCGSGFFLGVPTKFVDSKNMYWNNRYIMIYSGMFNSEHDLLDRVSALFRSSLNTKFPSPVFIDQHSATTLRWDDSFIVWFELYDFYGDLITLIRLEREGTRKDDTLFILLVNPDTMKDQDGDLVEIVSFAAPNHQWNFELFRRYTQEEKKKIAAGEPLDDHILQQENKLIIVTVTETAKVPGSTEVDEIVFGEEKPIGEIIDVKKVNDVVVDENEVRESAEGGLKQDETNSLDAEIERVIKELLERDSLDKVEEVKAKEPKPQQPSNIDPELERKIKLLLEIAKKEVVDIPQTVESMDGERGAVEVESKNNYRILEEKEKEEEKEKKKESAVDIEPIEQLVETSKHHQKEMDPKTHATEENKENKEKGTKHKKEITLDIEETIEKVNTEVEHDEL